MNNTSLAISVISSITILLFALILSNSYKYKYNISNTINVTGNAKKDFESDIVKWTAYYSRKSTDLSVASEQLNQDRKLVRDFLIEKGINENEILFNAVNIVKDYSYYSDSDGRSYQTFTGYSLTQNVSVESKDLDKVTNASREISALISQGIELSSNLPNYYYSKLEDLKLELISQASENARLRAENIAKESSSAISKLLKADLGVFQITGQNDDEDFSYGGAFNTTARYKTANVTVRTSYLSK